MNANITKPQEEKNNQIKDLFFSLATYFHKKKYMKINIMKTFIIHKMKYVIYSGEVACLMNIQMF